MKIVALIPARAGSKRVPGKNTRLLGGKPLIQWTLEAAKASGAFDELYVCTDDNQAMKDAGAMAAIIPRKSVRDTQPDIEWVRSAISEITAWRSRPDAFAILRPTSPFRTADTIRRAISCLSDDCDSVRAVQLARENPYKMWTIDNAFTMRPLLLGNHPNGTPFHSSPTQSLPSVYVQNSSLEIAWSSVIERDLVGVNKEEGTISGKIVRPFLTEHWEGFAIDYPEDWERAEQHASEIASLARV